MRRWCSIQSNSSIDYTGYCKGRVRVRLGWAGGPLAAAAAASSCSLLLLLLLARPGMGLSRGCERTFHWHCMNPNMG
jgi:hypothetical protein